MSFSGRVKEESHEGGLMVTFEGKAPRLGANIRISGGKIIGRVDTVLGHVDSPLIHVHPLSEGVDSKASVGSPVEIAPGKRKGSHRSKRRHAGFKRERGRGTMGRKEQGRHGGRSNVGRRGESKRGGRPNRKSGGRRDNRGGVRRPSNKGGRPNRKSVGRRDSRRSGKSRRRG